MLNKIEKFVRRLSGRMVAIKNAGFPKKWIFPNKKKVLVLGVYLADRENLALHLMREFEKTNNFIVSQRWIAIGGEFSATHNKYTIKRITRAPKFRVLNDLISKEDLNYFDYILISDDDIYVPRNFLDGFLGFQQKLGFALAQPARTRFSYADHKFTLRNFFLIARETDFVEIGPIFCVAKVAYDLIFPFDMDSPMGWGYDFIWPELFKNNNLKIGIIDRVAVAHVIRPQADAYSRETELSKMYKFLAKYNVFATPDGFVTRRFFYRFPLNIFRNKSDKEFTRGT